MLNPETLRYLNWCLTHGKSLNMLRIGFCTVDEYVRMQTLALEALGPEIIAKDLVKHPAEVKAYIIKLLDPAEMN